ncbi:dual specificity protein phosphatase 6-like [Halichondria panicea]|uniref:dual specificity protein phosphatase 6-like n=1 Tax=Halichondria panicea TaxID=6063 RepID=UPI00312B8D6F
MVKCVDATWVAKQDPQSILLLDTREVSEYNAGFIPGSVNICCTGMILRRLKNGSLKVECLLNLQEDKDKLELAKEAECVQVIVCDRHSRSLDDLQSDSVAALLLKRLSRDCKFVAFLSGGFEYFAQHYPQLCDLEMTRNDLLQRRPSSLVLQLSNIALGVTEQASNGSDSEESSPSEAAGHAPYEILPHLFLGCRKVAASLQHLKDSRITRILNVTSSEPNNFESQGFEYKQIAVEDSHDVNMLKYLPDAFCFIEDARMNNEKVLVHCHAGMSRSVTVILAYLMKNYHHTLDSAYDFVKQRKQNISPNFGFMGQLLEYECSLRSSPADSGFGGSANGSPMNGHIFLSSSPLVLPNVSRSFVLAN